MKHIKRKLGAKILSSLKNHPVVFVNGPRQSGKSTLVRKLAEKEFPAEYVTFDNATQMAAAAAAPHSFLSKRDGPLIIDEVQIVPELFRELKMVVDELRLEDKANSNGRFLLTGSANIMALPKLSEALVGRMGVLTLLPFSACEVFGLTEEKGDFLEHLFAKDFSHCGSDDSGGHSLIDAIRHATFPEISGKKFSERSEWFDAYLTTILQRDVRMMSELEKIAQLPNMLRVLANRAGALMNDAEIARDLGLNPVTSKSYRGILQAVFLCFDVRPWYRNIGKRLVKSPKGYLVDTLLLCHLLGWRLEDLQEKQAQLYGHVVENFVATELSKLLSFSKVRAQLMHFRTSDNKEIDFVLEQADGKLAAIEVKTSERVGSSDFKGIRVLKENAAKDFQCGVVLYGGKEVVPFGEDLYAVPFQALWS